MKTRLILFYREQSENPEANGRILFARWSETLLIELPQNIGVEEFAKKHNLRRYSEFDHSVGGMGRDATLQECTHVIPQQLVLDQNRNLDLTWEIFPRTAQALQDGQDRRFLQLAVQYLASGARLDDSVIAADYDAEFLQQLQKTLASQENPEKNSD